MEINLEKSKPWISPSMVEEKKASISNFLQISHCNNLGNYLGYPLKLTYKSSNFNHILDKIHQKLQGWKQNSLPFAGRTQLITSTTNSIHAYHMCVFNLPRKIKNQIDQINRNFLWGHSQNNRKIHLINWDKITTSK